MSVTLLLQLLKLPDDTEIIGIAEGAFSVAGRYAWQLANPRAIPPIPIGGKPGIYDCAQAAQESVREVFPNLW